MSQCLLPSVRLVSQQVAKVVLYSCLSSPGYLKFFSRALPSAADARLPANNDPLCRLGEGRPSWVAQQPRGRPRVLNVRGPARTGDFNQQDTCGLTFSEGVCPVLSCLVLSCLVLSCLVLSCLVLSCLVLSCLVLSCLVLSCPLLSSPLLSSPLLSSPLLSSPLLSSPLLSCPPLSCPLLSSPVLSCPVLSCHSFFKRMRNDSANVRCFKLRRTERKTG